MRTTILLIVLSAAVALAQAPKAGVRSEIRVFKVQPPPPPQPEPGDSVELNAVTGDIVATSHGLAIRLPRRDTDIAPSLAVSYAESAGKLNYFYTLENQRGAKRAISGLSLAVPNAAAATATVPSGWFSIKGEHSLGVPSILFANKNKDADLYAHLTSGKSVSFSLTSTDVPGLVRAIISPLEEPSKPGELTDGEFFDSASEWVRQRLLQMDTRDRRELYTYSIGPKQARAQDGVAAIQSELRAASGLPEFREIGQPLLQASSLATLPAIRSALAGMGAATPLQRDFVAAMNWRIATLSK